MVVVWSICPVIKGHQRRWCVIRRLQQGSHQRGGIVVGDDDGDEGDGNADADNDDDDQRRWRAIRSLQQEGHQRGGRERVSHRRAIKGGGGTLGQLSGRWARLAWPGHEEEGGCCPGLIFALFHGILNAS